MNALDPLHAIAPLSHADGAATLFALDRLAGVDPERLARRPRTTRILLENLLRHFHRGLVSEETLRALASGRRPAEDTEIPFFPARVLLQDFTGVPVLVDLGAIREAARRRGIDGDRVSPVVPAQLVVDHSVQVDSYGSRRSASINLDREFSRNGERYDYLRWAQGGFRNLTIVPPGNGIVHQVNLEYLATVVAQVPDDGHSLLFPDTLIGTDSHTTMVNGLGVLAWGVGGIEAEAAMLGEPTFLGVPTVVGVRLSGQLPEGTTATDLVLTTTHRLRAHGVVDKFVEFYGPGLDSLSVPDRATISNMCPEYGATAALFPIDAATLEYLRATGRPPEVLELVESYARRQGLWRDAASPDPEYDERLDIDLAAVVPTVAGPRNPEESLALPDVPAAFAAARAEYRAAHAAPTNGDNAPPLADGAVVIAAITSCTNTSNPSVMVGAGLIARRAVERGLKVPAHVKTSLAPGSKVVTAYLQRAGLLSALETLGFDVVGYGCTTCIGNSGPLSAAVAHAIETRDSFVAAVLSGNRNFEARIHNQVRANFLASPMLVVAYALAGRVDLDLSRDAIGTGSDGDLVYLRDLWPSGGEVRALVGSSLDPSMFVEKYRAITRGDAHWESLPTAVGGAEYPWKADSTYLRRPPYFDLPPPLLDSAGRLVQGARALALLGDRISTDHISPAGEIAVESPAGQYLIGHGVPPGEFNTYGTRRGNHEVMVRGTFANVRLKNRLANGKEGGWTTYQPSGELLTIFDAANRYRADKVPLVVLAGQNYGQGSSRDWAAKGPLLLGVRAVLAESFERIHRSNLVGMAVLPLVFAPGEGARQLRLDGTEEYTLRVADGKELASRCAVDAEARRRDGSVQRFRLTCRIDSPVELAYFRAGGLLPYVLDRIVARERPSAAS